MKLEEVKEQILEIVKKISENENIEIESKLLDEGWIDSLSTILLIDELEKKFNITINNDDLTHDNFNSIEKIYDLINFKK